MEAKKDFQRVLLVITLSPWPLVFCGESLTRINNTTIFTHASVDGFVKGIVWLTIEFELSEDAI
jgi:hypothetical protein